MVIRRRGGDETGAMATPAPSTGDHSHAHELRADDYPGLLHEQRHRISALAHSLTPEQWTAPSLCDGWRVCDVLGHITYGYTTPLPKVLTLIVFRYRGDVNRGSDVVSRALADELTQDELVERLDAGLDHPVGLAKTLKPPEALADHLVHELDIRRPLGLPVELEPALLVGALERADDRQDQVLRSREGGRGTALPGPGRAVGPRRRRRAAGGGPGRGPDPRHLRPPGRPGPAGRGPVVADLTARLAA